MKLYNIADAYRKALESIEIDPETGEVVFLDNLDELNDAFETKAEAVACYIKELYADVKALKEEEDTLKARRLTTEKRAKSLMQYLSGCMSQVGKDKMQTPRCALSFRRSTQVHILDESKLPESLLKVKTEPDKTAIKDLLKNGTAVEGAELISVRNLQIK